MLWVWIAAAVGLAGSSLVWLGFIPSPLAATLIRCRNGTLEVRKGPLLPHARAQVAEILAAAAVSNCFITVTPRKRVFFSRQIPAALHQRLRNVILNG
jgi:hypothetical protein